MSQFAHLPLQLLTAEKEKKISWPNFPFSLAFREACEKFLAAISEGRNDTLFGATRLYILLQNGSKLTQK